MGSSLNRKKGLIIGAYIVSIVGLYYLLSVDRSMKIVQSKVYPNLFLIKNEINDRDSLHKIIKKMVVEKMTHEFIGYEEKSKLTDEGTADLSLRTSFSYSINFYTYSESWGINPFGDAGTAHFIDNEEDPGGFSSEELGNYRAYRIASLEVTLCENDTANYIGILNYYKNENLARRDTLIDGCDSNKVE